MKDWQAYCETTFNSLKANKHNWGKSEFARPLTRIYYINAKPTDNMLDFPQDLIEYERRFLVC